MSATTVDRAVNSAISSLGGAAAGATVGFVVAGASGAKWMGAAGAVAMGVYSLTESDDAQRVGGTGVGLAYVMAGAALILVPVALVGNAIGKSRGARIGVGVVSGLIVSGFALDSISRGDQRRAALTPRPAKAPQVTP